MISLYNYYRSTEEAQWADSPKRPFPTDGQLKTCIEGKLMKLSEVFLHWAQVRADLLSTLDEFEDEELSYIPYEGSWSVGEIALHIANAEEGWIQYVLRQETDEWPDEFTLPDYPSVVAIKALLSEVHTRTEHYLELLEADAAKRVVETPWGTTITLGWVVWHVLEHEIHHRGELSLILGMLGRVGLEV